MFRFAVQVAPEEACGLVFASGLSVSIRNRATEPQRYFELWPQDILDCLTSCGLSLDEVRAVWHSHPISASTPSPEDCRVMKKTQLPMFIVSLTTRRVAGFVLNADGRAVRCVDHEVTSL